MLKAKIKIKPLSVNQARQGRRFKTPLYKNYEKTLLLLLPKKKLEPQKIEVRIVCGYSNKLSDLDNMTKQFLDTLTKKYWIDDRYIYRIVLTKKIVEKWQEYIEFEILPYTE